PVLHRVTNLYLAGQIFTILTFVLILSGTLALNRQLYGQWSVLPLIAFPLLYNYFFLIGTMNFLFGVGLALWALAAWVALRERAMPLGLIVSTLSVLMLFFCHLFAVGVYGLGVLAFELQRALGRDRPLSRRSEHRQHQWRSGLFHIVACGVPFLPVVPLLLASPTWGLRGTPSLGTSANVDGLVHVVEVYSHFATLLLTAIVAFAAGWGIRHRALQFHPFGWALLAVGGVLYLAMPRLMFETYLADQRLALALAFMVVASAHLNLRHDFVRLGFATIVVVLLAVRVFEVQSTWDGLARETASFRDSVRQIERGSKLLVAYAEPNDGDDVLDFGLVHAACLAIIERSALVTTAFTVVGKQILHVREDYRARVDTQDGTPPSVRQLLQAADQTDAPPSGYWGRWTADFDYLYVLFTDPGYQNPAPARLTPIFAGERFVLYQINTP